jgi:hypothetical protein
MAVVADQQNRFGGDFVVDARAILGRCGGVATLKTSGNYDSLLLTAARIHVSLVPFGFQAKRGSVMDASGNLSWCAGVALSSHLAGVALKIGWKSPGEKGYSATSRRDSASFLILVMKVSSGMAPKSLPDLSRTATFPSAASRSPTTSM